MDRRWIIRAGLVVATAGIYAQTLGFGFVSYDDPILLNARTLVRNGLTLDSVRTALTTIEIGLWHPVSTLSHRLAGSLFGANPAGHHLINVLLHLVNALLLFELLVRSTRAVGRSAFVAALFAIHPMHVESVAWLAERKDVLSGFFGLLTLCAYLRYAREPRPGTYLPVLLAFALGLASKPMLVTLPFVLLLFDYWPLARLARGDSPARLVVEKLPLFALTTGMIAVTFFTQRAHGSLESGKDLPFFLRAAHAAVAYVWYAVKLAWPSDLAILYPHPYLPGGLAWAGWQVAGAISLLIAITTAILLVVRRPYATVGWFWYLGMLVPVIGLVPAGVQGMADRYTYLPSIGLFLIVAWGGGELAARLRPAWAPRAVAALTLLALLALATAAWAQARCWHDSVSLYQRSLAVTGGRSAVHANLGAALRAEGRISEAISVYHQGLRLHPESAVIQMNLGNALLDQGRTGEAIHHFREALRIDPEDATAHANLARALAARREFAAAEAEAREAIRLKPEDSSARRVLADIQLARARFEAAAKP